LFCANAAAIGQHLYVTLARPREAPGSNEKLPARVGEFGCRVVTRPPRNYKQN
jgi:hypothetical protein